MNGSGPSMIYPAGRESPLVVHGCNACGILQPRRCAQMPTRIECLVVVALFALLDRSDALLEGIENSVICCGGERVSLCRQ